MCLRSMVSQNVSVHAVEQQYLAVSDLPCGVIAPSLRFQV